MSAPCTVRLEVFEGPLDLLLHLIKRSEVQITDIPIASITDQYLAALEGQPDLNLDGAGEYLVMAATLMYIKSRMLLPTEQEADDEPEEDPRAALVQQLLEYQRFREVAAALRDRTVLERDVFAPPGEAPEPAPPGEEQPPPVRDASLADLLAALREVLRRHAVEPPHEIGARPSLSVAECVSRILARFALGPEIAFQGLFAPEADLAELIVTFLALLELVRLRVVRAEQVERFGAIRVRLAVADLEEAAARVRDMGQTGQWKGGGIVHGHGSA